MSKHKKLLTSAVALGTAAAMVLGGTFAWQSISQKATNEASDIVNPGGRLHNDQHWVSDLKNDTNIYVENFAEDTIYARVRLSEYMEIVMNYNNTAAQAVETVAGKKLLNSVEVTDKATDNTSGYTYQYDIHYFGKDNATDKFFSWTKGSDESETVWYMPTFNKNKDSLLADLNGEYVDTLGGISNRGENQYTYTYDEVEEGKTAGGWEVYDGDKDTNDDVTRAQLKDLIANGTNAEGYENLKSHVALVEAKGEKAHKAAKVGTTKDLISMSDWLQKVTENGYAEGGVLTDEGRDAMYGYWVYDTDGWVYWSAPIEKGETTGLLLDGFELKGVMDDTWYYAIDVEAQFVTPDDVGKDDGTGFYTVINAGEGVNAVADGETETTEAAAPITESAEKLLALLGVYIPEDSEEDTSGPTLQIDVKNDKTWYMPSDNTVGAAVNLEVTGATIYDYSKNWGEDGFQTAVPESEWDNIEWSISGNTSSSTVLSSTKGKTNVLTIGNDETAAISITAKLTYNGISGEGVAYVDNEPYVISAQIYHVDGNVLSGVDYYEAGQDNGYELLFFPVYYSSVFEYSREEAHTGAAREYLTKGTTWALGHMENYQFVADESIEGVTLTQDENDPSKVTLTIAAGYNQTFALGATNSEGTTYHSELKPKVASLSLDWPDGVTYNDTSAAVNLTPGSSVTPTASYTEAEGNESLETRSFAFYVKNLKVTTSGYKVLKDMTEDVWVIYDDEIDAEYGWQVDEEQRLIVISEDDGSIKAKDGLEENISLTYELVVGCNGYQITRNVTVNAGPAPIPDSEGKITEIVTSTDTETALKVTYKRNQTSYYVPNSNLCEFNFKPEYNGEVVTDTSKLSLSLKVGGEEKGPVTGSGFSESGDGWLTCKVGVVGGQTGNVDVTLTLTYTDTDTDTSLSTSPYTITFIPRS